MRRQKKTTPLPFESKFVEISWLINNPADRFVVPCVVFPTTDFVKKFADKAEERKNAAQASDLIVNATPLGMHPSINASPLPDNMSFGPRHTVYDLIYNPDPTLLLEHAAGQGAVTIGGLAMLIGQAAAAFSIWTGQEMPVGEVEKIVREALHTKRRS